MLESLVKDVVIFLVLGLLKSQPVLTIFCLLLLFFVCLFVCLFSFFK